MKNFELSAGDIFVLFFLTLGPLKAILPFARSTHGTELAFQRTVAWRAMAIATVIALVVALLAPLVLGNWHVSPPASSCLPRRSGSSCSCLGQWRCQREHRPALRRRLQRLRFSR